MRGNADLEAQILVRCARHCCICRKFKPQYIQIHHIKPKSMGGSDSEENLAPICSECHSSIHSNSSMTKNFTETEIRMARDKIYDLAESGRLHGAATLSDTEIGSLATALNKAMNREPLTQQHPLSLRAIKILLATISEGSGARIMPLPIRDHGETDPNSISIVVKCGLQEFFYSELPFPGVPLEITDLVKSELLENIGGLFSPTPKAFELLNLVRVNGDSPYYFAKKVQCDDCFLHFTIFTWHQNRHHSNNLYCPECGQNSGRFSIWWQREPGFIYEAVPGTASPYTGE